MIHTVFKIAVLVPYIFLLLYCRTLYLNISILFLITDFFILEMKPWSFRYKLVTVELVRFSYHLIYLRRHLQSNFKPMLHTIDTHLHKWCHVLPFTHTKEKKSFKKSVFVFYCLISKMVVYLNLYITDSCTPYQSTRRVKK